VAMTIGSLLFMITAFLVVGGIVATPFLIDTIAPGFVGGKRDLTIKLVQIFFPGTGMVVMSAWCLGILNSHRRFFLSYAAPVIWNVAIIATLLFFGKDTSQYDLAIITGWGLVAGSFLQVLVQIPTTIKLLKYFRPRLDTKVIHVQIIMKNFVPSVVSRGVVQVSSYIDNILASLLPTGAVSALAYAQTIYLLPVSLFGMSISASELPEMSSIVGSQEVIYQKLRERLQNSIQKISFYIVPSLCAFLILGDVLVAALYQTGEFNAKNTQVVWVVLIGSSVGLLASTIGRLYASTFYSLKDTKTTLYFAFARIFFTTILGYLFAFKLAPMISPDPMYATAGLTSSAGISGWIEFYLLRRKLNSIIGTTGVVWRYQSKLWGSALMAAAIGLSVKWFIHLPILSHPVMRAAGVFSIYGVLYFAITYVIAIPESQMIINKIRSKIGR
ncbi:MAG: murein biosynthesis integral membrane protein MurJ, partial [Bdellovibrionales bacterium]|nr:murein biosynthesis integral membrane protein MurJ [Bdellovibrionales bacterium]